MSSVISAATLTPISSTFQSNGACMPASTASSLAFAKCPVRNRMLSAIDGPALFEVRRPSTPLRGRSEIQRRLLTRGPRSVAVSKGEAHALRRHASRRTLTRVPQHEGFTSSWRRTGHPRFSTCTTKGCRAVLAGTLPAGRKGMRLSWNEIRARAAEFAREWRDAHYEKGETQSFYNDFFQVFGVKRRKVASFEEPVRMLGARRGFIDLFWRGTLLVEQKSAGHDLKPAKRQALDYFPGLQRLRAASVCPAESISKLSNSYDLDEDRSVALQAARASGERRALRVHPGRSEAHASAIRSRSTSMRRTSWENSTTP